MMYSRLALAAIATALFGVATAQLTIIAPGGPDLWWVANAVNTIVWTCQTSNYSDFTVLVANQALTSPIAIIAIENNFDCSKIITPDQFSQAPGTGYTIQLANTLNSTDVYAQSLPFEIKAAGAAYPATSATPTASGTSTSTGTAAGGAATASASRQTGASSNAKLSTAGFGLAAVGALFGFMA